MLLEACGANGSLTLSMGADLAPDWVVDIKCGTVEDEPVKVPAASTLAGGDIGCGELEFAAAEGDEVNRIRVWRELVDGRDGIVCRRFTPSIRDGHRVSESENEYE